MAQDNAVRKVIEAAGGPIKLSRFYDCTYAAINGWERQGWMPLRRARQAIEEWPDAAPLRDLVAPSIRAAMDHGDGQNLLK